MTTKVIELNDSAIKLGDDTGILVQSPGFALADGKLLHLGDAAEQQARLKPTSSFNKYWHELSMEPLSGVDQFRHAADIAHAHLMHLAETGAISSDVIFAVPGSFTQQQLGILLGIAGQTPLKPVGVVDSALAAAVAAASAQHIIYVDMQLHQVVLTRLAVDDEKIRTESVVQVPGVGSQNFMDLMMQVATGLFIEQSRFNPQHNAESEQQLYNALPSWLRQEANEQGSLLLELTSGGTVYSAKMPRQSLITNLNSHYQKIEQQIQALLRGGDAQVLLNHRIADMPGLGEALGHHADLVVVEPHAIHRGSLEFHDQIVSPETGIRRVTSLPLNDRFRQSLSGRVNNSAMPTHVLFNNEAYPAAGLKLVSDRNLNGSPRAAVLNLNIDGIDAELATIERRREGLFLTAIDPQLLVNNASPDTERALQLGDRLSLGSSAVEMSLIRVSNV